MKDLINQPEYTIKKILFGALHLLGPNGEKYIKPSQVQQTKNAYGMELALMASAYAVSQTSKSQETFEITRSYLNNLIQIELAYTGVTHLDYDKNSNFGHVKQILTLGMNRIK